MLKLVLVTVRAIPLACVFVVFNGAERRVLIAHSTITAATVAHVCLVIGSGGSDDSYEILL